MLELYRKNTNDEAYEHYKLIKSTNKPSEDILTLDILFRDKLESTSEISHGSTELLF